MQGSKYPMVKSEDDRFWKKYCGFLDLSLSNFMSIQESLLLQQLEKVTPSLLGKKLIGHKTPASIEEFRHLVPLTTYQDYLPELEPGNESALPEQPHVWAHTSGASGTFRRAPYTLESYQRSIDNLMSALVLACSKHRGQSSLKEGDRILFNVAPTPYLSGILATGASQVFNVRSVIPPDKHDNMDFREKITKGFEVSLKTGVDIMVAMTSVLVKTGNEFSQMSKKGSISKHFPHPGELSRLSRAYLTSKLEKRGILPKDLWPVKALIGWGIDTGIYRDQVYKYWGAYPYEFHASTEAGIIAVQSWSRQGLTFIPHSNFFEFIPEKEWLKSKMDVFYEPRTVLISEVKPGERYELVITSYYGMPFIRYRLGHMIRITSLGDEEAQIYLPQMVFEARADDLIDIAGFTRVCEKTVTQAIANARIDYEDWSIRKEIREGKPILHLYIELSHTQQPEELAMVLHQELMKTDPGYRDLAIMMESQPLAVTVLRAGTYRDYYQKQKENELELAQRKPPRMNASDDIIRELVSLGSRELIKVT
ncbi:MAG: hypothetical protein A2144_14305 [Chloroflexi bacterium RBG_16_50_9]|nr:MAG: hypothetical protein A2144_14305 [Chloroflexi bacterium RBG_16_50_9]